MPDSTPVTRNKVCMKPRMLHSGDATVKPTSDTDCNTQGRKAWTEYADTGGAT
jgi:hypothetical protein